MNDTNLKIRLHHLSIGLVALALVSACGGKVEPSDGGTEPDIADVGARDLGHGDVESWDATLASEDSGNSVHDRANENCEEDLDCPQGEICQPDSKCGSASGCGLLWNDDVPDDVGCFYNHEADPLTYYGYFSAAECVDDSECADSPFGDICIHRVCHEAVRCEVDSDCEAAEFCFNELLCVSETRIGKDP